MADAPDDSSAPDGSSAPGGSSALAAADALVADFATSDADAYFRHFAPEATFCFYTHPTRLEDRAGYERLWQRWVSEDGFRIISCHSSQRRVQEFGDLAIFTHTVLTESETTAGRERPQEKETIVFQRHDGGWVAVHEHLSPMS